MSELTGNELFITNDVIAVGLSVGYDTKLDYKKVNTTMIAEKVGFQVAGNALHKVIFDFMPERFRKPEEKTFFWYGSHRKHVSTGLVAGVYNYYINNKNLKDAAQEGLKEFGASLAGDYTRRALSTSSIDLKEDILL